MKQLISMILTLILAAAAFPAPAEGAASPAMTMKELPFYLNDEKDTRTIHVYFPADSDVPYLSLADWAEVMTDLMRNEIYPDRGISFSLTSAVSGEIGVLAREDGYTMTVDCAADTIHFLDYDAFLRPDPSRVLIDILSADNASLEKPVYFSRTGGSYERYGNEVTLEAGAYGIDLVSDGSACYVPLQTLGDFLLSPNYFCTYYNSEAVFIIQTDNLIDEETQELTEIARLLYSVGKKEISEATAAFGYSELCLAFDALYGLKETHEIESFDTLARQTGLRDTLRGTDTAAADAALFQIIVLHLDDLHSAFNAASPFSPDGLKQDLRGKYGVGLSRRGMGRDIQRYTAARKAVYPEKVPAYEEIGNTAYITFDEFNTPPKDADYYQEAPGPDAEDTISILLRAYQMITRENSPVENVVLDLSCNTGGDSDAAIFVLSAFLGDGYVSIRNTMSAALTTGIYNVDINLDHAFDQLDRALAEKKRFCLISPCSFSCGNLVPSVFKNSREVTLIGRASRGGACVVLPMSSAWGASFQLSGHLCLSFMQNGSFYDIERGTEPDISLQFPESFYDRAALTEMINTIR